VNDLGSTYDEHIFQLINVIPGTTTAALLLTYSIDNGSAFANSNYVSTKFGTVSGTTSSIVLAGNVTSNTEYGLNGWIHLYQPSSTTRQKHVCFSIFYFDTTLGNFTDAHGGGTCLDAAPDVVNNAVNAIKFAFSAGTISGTVRHYGIKNS
jgi:hypothetical protein